MSASTIGPRAQQGEATRARILNFAMNRASLHGLESLSIGELAKELGMSKSGLFAHFGSKEELQIATIGAAEIAFTQAIIKPALVAAEGLARLRALLERYVEYLSGGTFSGGCFFSAAAAEFDDRPGRVRDRIIVSMEKWNDLLVGEARNARARGELPADLDDEQLVFELKAFTHEANFHLRLVGEVAVCERALRGIRTRLSSVALSAK